MSRRWLAVLAFLAGGWVLLNLAVGWLVLPGLLLDAPLPTRTEGQREAIRQRLAVPGSRWERLRLAGGEGRPLEVFWLHRPRPRGTLLFLHGFGDDAWGNAARASDFPDWDAVVFTFRGRDLHPGVPCTLGGWERTDVAAVVQALAARGVPRDRLVLAGWSQGAGVALLALADLERSGRPLAGALLECPFADLQAAARNHLRGALGALEWLIRPAEGVALMRCGILARFDPARVSPLAASAGIGTPVALVTGDADPITPVEGVLAMAARLPDLLVVPGAGHCEASGRLPGGWKGWAAPRLARWVPG
jgi:pimeloyl-ACP methyl ester carboxylesterase